MILVLQTNIDHAAAAWIIQGGKVLAHASQTVQYPQRPSPLTIVDAVVKKSKKKPTQISGIIISRGPGRFSAVRSGIIIGNLLAKELDIPIAGFVRATALSSDDALTLAAKYESNTNIIPIRPVYGKKPNITVSKKKIRKL
jgi:tRNA A37 threonylcarbamoyladenosine modification protein TsaB